MKKKLAAALRCGTTIAAGALMLAAGLNLFLVPGKISSGGLSALGTVLLYLFRIPLSVTTLVFNAALFLLGYRFLGRSALIRTLLGVALLSLFLQLTAALPAYSGDLTVAALLGGLLTGCGVGITVRQNASTGGSDLAALLLHRFFPYLSIAALILIIDCAVVLLAALLFRSVTVACYSFLTLFVASRVTDSILTLGYTAKSVQIFSGENTAIAAMIMTRFRRGVTGLHSAGLYSGKPGLTLLCVVAPKELPLLIREVRRLDPGAFIVVSDVREVLGEGFPSRPE